MSTPTHIGPYEVVRPIAQGGMAEVFEVLDPATGERLALKLLQETRTSLKRFNREFEALTALNHPGIVRVYRYGFHGRQPWITMEMLDGQPLQSYVKVIGRPGDAARTTEVVRIGYYLAQALAYVHDRGLIHRDIKSANVQILHDGRVKIIDFGTAHLADPLERITQEGDFVGTFSYAAPEQIVGASVDARADLYSLGVMLYRMATGRRPFKGDDPQKVAQMHLNVAPRPAREVVPELPESLERLIAWCMEKKRRDRPQRAEQVAAALEEIAGHALQVPGAGLHLNGGRAIGRAPEARVVWEAVGEGRGTRLVVVQGGDARERGRFAADLCEDAPQRGLRAISIAAGREPTRSVVAALRALSVGQADPAVARVLNVLGDGRPVPVRAAAGLGAAVAADVAQLVATYEKPTLMVLPEVDELDAEAMGVLQQLLAVAARLDAPLSVVATAASGASVGVGALRRVLRAGTVVELLPLDVQRTALAVGEVLHRRPASLELARYVEARSQGRPSRIEAVVRALVEEELVVVRSDDGNRVETTSRFPPPALTPLALDDARERLAEAPLAWRRALEVLVTVGGQAAVKVVAAGLGWDEASTSVLVDEIVEGGLARRAGRSGGIVEIHDPVLLDTLGQQLAPERRLVVQHLVADVMETVPVPAVVDTLLAVGQSEPAVRLGLEVARRQLAGGAFNEAVDLLTSLRAAAGHPALEARVRAEYHLLLGRAVRLVRPMDAGGVKALNTALDLADAAPLQARVHLAFAELYAAIGHPGNYRKHLTAAWDLVGQTARVDAAEVALALGHQRVEAGDLSQAAVWFERARLAGRRGAFTQLARLGEGMLALLRGDLGKAAEVAEAVAEGAPPEGRVAGEATMLLAACWRRQGRFSQAIQAVERSLTAARQGTEPSMVLRLELALAEVELDLARLGSAQERVDAATAGMSKGEAWSLRLGARVLHGRVLLASGQIGLARRTLGEVVEQAALAGLVLVAERARGSLAEASWMAGARREAVDGWREAATRLMELGDIVSVADLLVGRARCIGGVEEADKAFRLVDGLLDRPEFRVLYLESALAAQRWHKAQGDAAASRRSLAEAQSVLTSIAARQDRVEQAALRVHPWMREVRRALGAAEANPAADAGGG